MPRVDASAHKCGAPYHRQKATRMAMGRAFDAAATTSPDRHPAIAWLAGRLAAVPAVERVILFGSRARGDHGQRSDIDLAVEAPGATLADRARMAELVEDAPALVGIDLVRLDEADAALRRSIELEGIVLHERR